MRAITAWENIMPLSPLTWLGTAYSHMGKNSGYDIFYDHLQQQWPSDCQYRHIPNNTGIRIFNKLISPWLSRQKPSRFYFGLNLYRELSLMAENNRHPGRQIHLSNVENDLWILGSAPGRQSMLLTGTVHQPEFWWKENHYKHAIVRELDGVVTLCKSQARFFETLIDPKRIRIIPHPVNTDFFRPLSEEQWEAQENAPPKCVFVGSWLRDFETLTETVLTLNRKDPSITFEIVVLPSAYPKLARIADLKQVHIRSNLDNETLRHCYQTADMLLLPLIDSTANNALLEGMACGIPIVSTDIGGVRDYVRPEFSRLTPARDNEGLANDVLHYLSLPRSERRCIGLQARHHAENNLSVPAVARQFIQASEEWQAQRQ